MKRKQLCSSIDILGKWKKNILLVIFRSALSRSCKIISRYRCLKLDNYNKRLFVNPRFKT